MDCGYFDTTRNDNHSSFLTPTVVDGRCPLPSEICATPFEKRRLRPISAYYVSTVRDSEKVRLSRAFQRAIDGLRTLLLSPERMAQKRFLSFY